MLRARPEIESLLLYRPGRSLDDARSASGRTEMVKLASNESLWGPSPLALEAVRRATLEMQYYPLVQHPGLGAVLARTHHVDEDQLVVGSGADELLRLLASAYVSPGDEVVYPHPSFSAYRHATLVAGGIPHEVSLLADGSNDMEALVRAISPRTRLVYVCTPNNPTGGAVASDAWQWYLDHVPDSVLTVVDGAYLEYSPDSPDYLQAVREGRPVAVVRTFSKLYALAGLRIGWAAAPPDVVKALLKTREPFSVSALASEAAQASLQDEDFFHRVRRETIDSRSRLMKALQERSQRFYPSATNFVSLSVGQEQVVAEALLKEGFVVRPADTFGLPGYLRITVGPWPIMEKFVTSLDRVLGS